MLKGWLYETRYVRSVSSMETSHINGSLGKSYNSREEGCLGFGSQAALISDTFQLCLKVSFLLNL